MQTFKAYFKIVKRNKVVIMIYLFLTIGLSFAMTRKDPVSEVFTEDKQNICVMDEDGSEFSKAIVNFVDRKHHLVSLKDDVDEIQDALYYGDISYLIRIPEGFGGAFLQTGDGQLDITTAQNSAGGVYISNQLEAYLNTYKVYIAMGYSNEQAIVKADESLNISTTVVTTEPEKKADGPYFQGFFRMMPYGFVSILIHSIGCVMIAFNDEEVSKRRKCSKTSSLNANTQIVLGSAILAIGVWMVHILTVVGVFQDFVFEYDGFGYLLVNSFALLLASLGIAFFFGSLSKTQTNVSIFGVSGSMFIAFLGGVFVPLDVIGEGTKRISRFLPSYWYTVNCEKLYSAKVITDSFKTEFIRGISVQLAFAAATIALAFLISKKKRA